MTYANNETEAIQVLVLRYKELDDKQRDYARHKTKCLSVWQGAKPETRKFNGKLLSALIVAEGDLRLAKKSVDGGSMEPYTPPTFLEVAMFFRPVVYIIVCLGGIAWLIGAMIAFVKGTMVAVGAFATAYGGWLFGGALIAALLSTLPKIEFTKKQDKTVTIEEWEKETLFYQREAYKKTTSTNG